MKKKELYEKITFITEKGKALDDDLNEFRNENGECVYIPTEDRVLFIIVKQK